MSGCPTTLYRGYIISWVKGSVCFVFQFAFPLFSPILPSGVQISKQNMHWTFDPRKNFTSVGLAEPKPHFPPPLAGKTWILRNNALIPVALLPPRPLEFSQSQHVLSASLPPHPLAYYSLFRLGCKRSRLHHRGWVQLRNNGYSSVAANVVFATFPVLIPCPYCSEHSLFEGVKWRDSQGTRSLLE